MTMFLLAIGLASFIQEPPAAGTDFTGDPLPPGAVARMGTTRLRHYSGILSVYFTPDGSRILSVGSDFAGGRISDKTLRVWDASTGRQLLFINGDDNVAVSPDRSLLVSWTMGRPALRLHDLATGKLLAGLANLDPPEFLGFSAAGKPLGHWKGEGDVPIFELDTGKEVCRISAAEWTPSAPNNTRDRDCAVSPSGREIARIVGESISFLDLAAGKERLRIKPVDRWIDQIRYSPDGKTLAVGSVDPILRLWDVETGTLRLALDHREKGTAALFFSADGAMLCTHDHRRLHLWELPSGRELASYDGTVATLSRDGATLAVALEKGVIELRDAKTRELRRELKGKRSSNLAFSPDGKVLASAAGSRVEVWDLVGGNALFPGESHAGWVHDVDFSPDGRTVATAGGDSSVRLWESDRGKPVALLRQGNAAIERLAFSPDGKTLVSASNFGELVWWDPADRTKIATAQGSHGGIYQLAFAPNGVVASASQKSVLLWGPRGERLSGLPGNSCVTITADGKRYAAEIFESSDLLIGEVATNRRVHRLVGHERPIRSILFFPDGRRLLSADCDHTVFVWDIETETRLQTFKDRCAMAVSPDGALLGLGDEAGVVRVWDASAGEELLEFKGHGHEITSLRFSPDSRRLASSSADGTALVWDLAVRAPARKEPGEWWTDLASRDGPASHRALCALAALPATSLPFLRRELSIGPAGSLDRLPKLIKDLEDDAPAVRDGSLRELALYDGAAALNILHEAIKTAAPEAKQRLESVLRQQAAATVESADLLRRSRAIRVLEWVGTAEALEVLEEVASKSTSPREQREARAAAGRLNARR